MPAGNAPQVKGVDAVIEWYENADIPAFAVCYLKDINLRYPGDDIDQGSALLRAWLEKVRDFDSAALYQLRLYENLKDRTINNKTEYQLSFKFVLNERDKSNYLPVKSEGSISNAEVINILKENAELKAENAVLNLKIDQYEEDDTEQDEKVAAIVKPIGEQLLEKFAPTLGAIGQAIGDRIVDFITPVSAKVSGIVIETGNIDEEKLIEQSIRRLKHKIPDNPGLARVLMKLADLAERSPSEFNMYMGILMKRNV